MHNHHDACPIYKGGQIHLAYIVNVQLTANAVVDPEGVHTRPSFLNIL